MEYRILWETAAVTDHDLTVSLSTAAEGEVRDSAARDEDSLSRREWAQFFLEIAAKPVAGLPYSIFERWRSVGLQDEVITVEQVSDRLVDLVRAHLDAVVQRSNAEYSQYKKQQEREVAQRTDRARDAGVRDRGLTDRFRQS